MNKLKSYDWSSIDIYRVLNILDSVRSDLLEKNLSPISVTKKIRTAFRKDGIPVLFKTEINESVFPSKVMIGGFYEGYKDKKNKKFITIILHYHSNSKIKINPKTFETIKNHISDTLMHEIVHLRQYRRRNYKIISGFMSFAESARKRNNQEYLGHQDEIDAYAFNIACELIRNYGKDKKSIVKYLNSDLSDNRRKKTVYRTYLETFDWDHNHQIIKSLKKKVAHYLPYAELGKPYKTSDWLKK